jgi:hypothetical protein
MESTKDRKEDDLEKRIRVDPRSIPFCCGHPIDRTWPKSESSPGRVCSCQFGGAPTAAELPPEPKNSMDLLRIGTTRRALRSLPKKPPCITPASA